MFNKVIFKLSRNFDSLRLCWLFVPSVSCVFTLSLCLLSSPSAGSWQEGFSERKTKFSSHLLWTRHENTKLKKVKEDIPARIGIVLMLENFTVSCRMCYCNSQRKRQRSSISLCLVQGNPGRFTEDIRNKDHEGPHSSPPFMTTGLLFLLVSSLSILFQVCSKRIFITSSQHTGLLLAGRRGNPPSASTSFLHMQLLPD